MTTFHKSIFATFLSLFLLVTVASPQRARPKSGGIDFGPKDSEFVVSFPGMPKITGSSAELNTADFTLQASYGAFRGVSLDDASLKAREIAINRNVGIPDSSVTVRQTRLGTEVETRAYYLGTLAESHFYVNPDTGQSILLYGAASKDSAKTKIIIEKFFNSITLNPRYVNTGYHFAPKDSEFEVTFPKKPILDNQASALTDNGLQTATLLIGTPDKGSKLTAYGGYSDTTLQAHLTSTDAELEKAYLNSAQKSGLSSAAVSVLKSKFGREIVTHGKVTVDGNQMLFEKHSYISAGSMIMLEVLSSKKSPPTQQISSFLLSVKLRK